MSRKTEELCQNPAQDTPDGMQVWEEEICCWKEITEEVKEKISVFEERLFFIYLFNISQMAKLLNADWFR